MKCKNYFFTLCVFAGVHYSCSSNVNIKRMEIRGSCGDCNKLREKLTEQQKEAAKELDVLNEHFDSLSISEKSIDEILTDVNLNLDRNNPEVQKCADGFQKSSRIIKTLHDQADDLMEKLNETIKKLENTNGRCGIDDNLFRMFESYAKSIVSSLNTTISQCDYEQMFTRTALSDALAYIVIKEAKAKTFQVKEYIMKLLPYASEEQRDDIISKSEDAQRKFIEKEKIALRNKIGLEQYDETKIWSYNLRPINGIPGDEHIKNLVEEDVNLLCKIQ